MQGAIICSQATLLFVLKREEWRGRKKEETNETNGPIFLLKHCFSSSFIKSRRRILFDWLITRSIHHWPAYPHRFDTAILDNLLRMTKRSLLPWLLFDLFNIRKLIFYPETNVLWPVTAPRWILHLEILFNALLVWLLQLCTEVSLSFIVQWSYLPNVRDMCVLCICVSVVAPLSHSSLDVR